jgi:hypothetical protein
MFIAKNKERRSEPSTLNATTTTHMRMFVINFLIEFLHLSLVILPQLTSDERAGGFLLFSLVAPSSHELESLRLGKSR